MLRNTLPEKGDFLTFKTVRQLHEALAFEEEEVEKFGLKQEGDSLSWNPQADVPRDFTFTKGQRELIEKLLTEKSEAGEITEDIFSLCEKFIGE